MQARSHIRRRRLLALSTALSGILVTASPAFAQQMGAFGTVQSQVGPVSVTANGTNLNVSATGSGIVNWADFNVAKGSAATFRNGNGGGAPAIAILNRVTGSTPTSIEGALSSDANIALYMINPNGIAFGPGAQVNLGSLVASTLDVTDADFLDGNDRLTFTSNGNRNAYVSVSSTKIRTEGDLLLLGDSIWSSGSLMAGGDLAAIAAGEVTVQSAVGSPLRYAVSRGALQARLYQSGEAMGRNVVLGAVGAAGVVDGLLEAYALVAATGVAATDHGITIFAGNEVSSPVVSVDPAQSARIDIKNTGQIRSGRDLIIAGNRNVNADTLSASGAITVGGRGILETNAAFAEEITLTGLYVYAGELSAPKNVALYGSEVASVSGNVETYNFVASGKAIVLGDDADSETIKASYIQANAGTGGVTGGAGLTVSSPLDTIFTTNGGVSFDPSARVISGRTLVFGGAPTQRITLADVDVGAISGLEQWQSDVTFGKLKVGSDLLIATTDDLRADTITSTGSMILEGARMEFGGDLLSEGNLAVTGKVLTGQSVTSRSGDVRIETAAGVVAGAVSGREVSISVDSGGVIAGDVQASKSIFMNADGGGLTLGNVRAAENILLLADGQLNADDLIGGNDVVAAAAEALVGDVRAEAGSVQIDAFAGSLTAGNVIAAGGVQLNGPAEGAGSGVVSVGAISAGENVQIISDSLRLDHDLTGQAVWISVDDGGSILLNGNLTARSLNLAGGAALQGTGTRLDVGTVSGSLSGALQLDGANSIGAIRDLSAASLALTNAEGWTEIIGSNRFSGDARIETGGDIRFGAGAELAGEHVSLSIGGRFSNGAGAGAITAAKNWAVYLRAPDGHAFGGLDSGNRAVWGSDATNAPVADLGGNRYVFAVRPTLTFASQDASKTYGTDASAIVADSYKVTGLHQGAAGAFGGDLLADVVQGNALLSSAGSDIRAGVAGGPYRIDIAQGSLVATGGYELAFESKGALTVLPKLLSATATVSDKIYDGSDVASGTIAIGGVLFGDQVTASGAFRFADKHTGIGKVVTTSAIILEGADAANYSVDAPAGAVADILRKSAQVTMVADDKIYDGTAFAAGRIGAIDGLVTGDDVVLSSGSFQFSDQNAGSAKTVSISDLRFGGADASNYDFAAPSIAVADILRKDLLVGVVADSKTYDGGTEAAGRITTIKGLIAGDEVSVDAGTFAFADKNAGVGKQVLVSGIALAGTDSGNYNLVAPASTTADILRKDLVIAVAADSKTYDGSTASSGRITGTDGLVAGDSVSFGGGAFAFADKNAGIGKQVLVSGVALAGADSGNYNLVAPASATADILRKDLVVAVVADSKTYDGSTAASGRITGTDGLVAGDSVSVGGAAAFAFADKNAGIGKPVQVSGIALGGADSGNYNLVAPASATADILRKDVLIAVAADAKTYDGSTRASGRITRTDGIVAGDSVSFTSGSFAFANKNAGESKEVLVTGIAIGGSDAGNYNLVVPERTAATIGRQVLHVGIVVDDKVYDGNAQAIGRVAALEGLVAGDQLVMGGGRYAFSDPHAGRDKQISVSGLSAQGADAGNYVLALAPAITADIFKRTISVRADDVHATWYAPTPSLSFSIVAGSLVDGDGFTGGLQRDPGSAPGAYRIHQGTLALSDDYDLHVRPGTFTIDLDPSVDWSPRLYQEYELGGRAQGLREAQRPLLWKASSNCRSFDPETVCP